MHLATHHPHVHCASVIVGACMQNADQKRLLMCLSNVAYCNKDYNYDIWICITLVVLYYVKFLVHIGSFCVVFGHHTCSMSHDDLWT